MSDLERVNGSGWISDESDFYGDDTLKDDLEARVASLDISDRLPVKHASSVLNAIAEANAARPQKNKDSVELYNPYEEIQAAWHLSETVDEFLKRVPPASSRMEEYGPWIWITNPYEGKRPAEERSDLAGFMEAGQELLEEWLEVKQQTELSMKGKAQSTITRKVNQEKKVYEERLLKLAKESQCTTDKWMLFPSRDSVNSTWAAVAHATAGGQLGIGSKVATDEGGKEDISRLICVYTKDFSDMKDLKRVVGKLVELGLVGRDRGVYYKCDALTHLAINSGNPYGFKASLYASKDVLAKK